MDIGGENFLSCKGTPLEYAHAIQLGHNGKEAAMLKTEVLVSWIFFLVLSAMLAAPATAQKYTPVPHKHLDRNFTPIPHRHAQTEFGGDAKSQQEEDDRMERERLAACERMKAEASAPDQIPFGHWAYQHNKAHCLDWVRQLQESTGVSCCSNPYGGECRVSRMDFVTKKFEVDGMWCATNEDTRWGVIDKIGVALVLVCASRPITNAGGERQCPNIHCVGRPAGG